MNFTQLSGKFQRLEDSYAKQLSANRAIPPFFFTNDFVKLMTEKINSFMYFYSIILYGSSKFKLESSVCLFKYLSSQQKSQTFPRGVLTFYMTVNQVLLCNLHILESGVVCFTQNTPKSQSINLDLLNISSQYLFFCIRKLSSRKELLLMKTGSYLEVPSIDIFGFSMLQIQMQF